MSIGSSLPSTRYGGSTIFRGLALVGVTVLLAGLANFASSVRTDHENARVERTLSSRGWHVDLPPNTWMRLETNPGHPKNFRIDHSGAEYVPQRDSVFLFGSDSHLRHFDNRILELRLSDLSWHYAYAQSPRFTQRTDARGQRIAGVDRLLPWPMHVYDAMVYDTTNQEILVFSGAKHSFIAAPGAQTDPVWAYSPEAERWRVLEADVQKTPNFFAAGVVYDSVRDTIVAYGSTAEITPFIPLAAEDEIIRTGVWELGPDRRDWYLVSERAHHWGWFNVEFDEASRSMIVFGGDKFDSDIWVYKTGEQPGQAGVWEKRTPNGERCPSGYYFPASYDSKRRVTLFMPHDRVAGVSATCLYDAARNISFRLPNADLPWLGLNYTLVYASRIDVFVLIAGSFSRNEPTSVWALQLDLARLGP